MSGLRRPSSIPAPFPLGVTLLALLLFSGCATTSWVVETATREGKPRFDDLVAVEGAWAGDDRLVVAFSGYAARSPSLRDSYSAPIFDEPSAWWFDANLADFRDFARLPRPPREGAAPWPPLRLNLLVERSALREGAPPAEALEGVAPVAVVDLRDRVARRREAFLRDDAARREQALYVFLRSEDYDWRGNVAMTLHYLEREATTGRLDLLRVELAPETPPPRPMAWALLPLAAVADVALFPVHVAMGLLGVNTFVFGVAPANRPAPRDSAPSPSGVPR
jgi:hypothetical protein